MALYHKIAEFIMEKIKTEEWKKGQLIPSEKEFCEQFQVSRPTVRAAIAYLANQGVSKWRRTRSPKGDGSGSTR